jgi:hypothetical protein
MFSVITNICNKKNKGPTWMESFRSTGTQIFFSTGDVRCVYHGWHGTHHTIFKFLPHTRQYPYSSLLQWSLPLIIFNFIMFSVITNIYNKKTKGPTWIKSFRSTGKLNFFQLETFDVCTTGDTVHIDKIFKFLPHTRQYPYSSLLQWSLPLIIFNFRYCLIN